MTSPEEAEILVRAAEGGAFDDLYAEWEMVPARSSAERKNDRALVERASNLLGRRLRKGEVTFYITERPERFGEACHERW